MVVGCLMAILQGSFHLFDILAPMSRQHSWHGYFLHGSSSTVYMSPMFTVAAGRDGGGAGQHGAERRGRPGRGQAGGCLLLLRGRPRALLRL